MGQLSDCAGMPNLEIAGERIHVHLIMECWNCGHVWTDCTNEEHADCPECRTPNWVREPLP